MTDLQFCLEKASTDEAECRLIADRATDKLKRAAFEKLADMHCLIAEALEKAIAIKRAAE